MGLNIKEIKPYKIPMAEFRNSNGVDFEFHHEIDDPVTRKNFTGFMAAGFMISRGQPRGHKLYALRNHLVTGLQIADTVTNYSYAGGFESLQESERNFLFSSFERARQAGATHKFYDQSRFGEGINIEFGKVREADSSEESMKHLLILASISLEDFVKLTSIEAKRFIAEQVKILTGSPPHIE